MKRIIAGAVGQYAADPIYQDGIYSTEDPVPSPPIWEAQPVTDIPVLDIPQDTMPTPGTRLTGTYVEGVVVDGKTGISLSVYVSYVNAAGEVGQGVLAGNGQYNAWTDEDTSKAGVLFATKGYKNKFQTFDQLLTAPDVLMEKPIPIQYILLVAAAVLVIRKKTGKVGAFTSGNVLTLFLLVGGVMGFSIIKEILEFLGLWKDKNEKDLDTAESNPNSFWNPTYWQTIKPAGANWTYAITQATAREWCTEIWDAVGAFNDCEECIKSVFRRCRTKANASFLAWQFDQQYNRALLPWLRGGIWPADRLSDADVNEINQYIERLPNY